MPRSIWTGHDRRLPAKVGKRIQRVFSTSVEKTLFPRLERVTESRDLSWCFGLREFPAKGGPSLRFGRKDKREEGWTPVFTGERRKRWGKERDRGKKDSSLEKTPLFRRLERMNERPLIGRKEEREARW